MIRSRFFIWAFTVATALLFASAPSRAQADGVVLYPVMGSADHDALDEVEAALAASLVRVGHRRVNTPGGIRATRPTTSAQMEGVVSAAGARYVVLAEIELTREDECFACPPWLGAEVSGDPRYYNSNLAIRPYRSWA